MTSDDSDRPLNHISTLWTVVCQAHEGPPEVMTAAQEKLLQRYYGAVYRYLLGALRNPDAAADLAQEFSLRFVRGSFRNVDPQRGRFRDFVKGVLGNLVADYCRRRTPRQLGEADLEEAALVQSPADSQAQFLESWRQELLARAWAALERIQQQTGQPFHTVLRLRRDQPQLRSAQIAELLGAQLGKPFTETGVRQLLHRARARLAELLVDEVVQTLRNPTVEELEQELGDLDLLKYCRPALDRLRPRT